MNDFDKLLERRNSLKTKITELEEGIKRDDNIIEELKREASEKNLQEEQNKLIDQILLLIFNKEYLTNEVNKQKNTKRALKAKLENLNSEFDLKNKEIEELNRKNEEIEQNLSKISENTEELAKKINDYNVSIKKVKEQIKSKHLEEEKAKNIFESTYKCEKYIKKCNFPVNKSIDCKIPMHSQSAVVTCSALCNSNESVLFGCSDSYVYCCNLMFPETMNEINVSSQPVSIKMEPSTDNAFIAFKNGTFGKISSEIYTPIHLDNKLQPINDIEKIGVQLACALNNKTIKLIDLNRSAITRTILPYFEVKSLCSTDDFFVCGGMLGNIKIYDKVTFSNVFKVKKHTKEVFKVCTSSCMNYIYSMSLDGTVQCHDTRNLDKEVWKKGRETLDISNNDLAMSLCNNESAICVGSSDGRLLIIDSIGNVVPVEEKNSRHYVTSVFAENMIIAADNQNVIRFWDDKN